jgi:hypothetical protein
MRALWPAASLQGARQELDASSRCRPFSVCLPRPTHFQMTNPSIVKEARRRHERYREPVLQEHFPAKQIRRAWFGLSSGPDPVFIEPMPQRRHALIVVEAFYFLFAGNAGLWRNMLQPITSQH